MRPSMTICVVLFLIVANACVTVNREIVVDRGDATRELDDAVVDQPRQPPPPDQTEPPPSVAEGYFDEPLSPYGNWSYSGRYGRIWVPFGHVVGHNWRPYTYGHWSLTEYGWTWVSDFSWGWAPFHYGRWAWEASYGWVWLPGRDWGPAWVYWRTGPGYTGWAAMPPGAAVGSAIAVATGTWIFIESMYFLEHRMHSHIIYGSRVRDCYRYTSVYDSYSSYHSRRYYHGPRRDYVSRHTHRVSRYRPARSLDRPNRPVYRPPSSRTGHHGSGRRDSSAHAAQPSSGESGHGNSARSGRRDNSGHGSTGHSGSLDDRDHAKSRDGAARTEQGTFQKKPSARDPRYRPMPGERDGSLKSPRRSQEDSSTWSGSTRDRLRTVPPPKKEVRPVEPRHSNPSGPSYKPRPAPERKTPPPRRAAPPPRASKPEPRRSSPAPSRSAPPKKYSPPPRRSSPPARSKPSNGSSKKTKKKNDKKKPTPRKPGR